MTTHERKIEWMGGNRSELIRRAAERMFARHGAAWLTDEQIDEIVSRYVADQRFIQRLNRKNRAASARRAAEIERAGITVPEPAYAPEPANG